MIRPRIIILYKVTRNYKLSALFQISANNLKRLVNSFDQDSGIERMVNYWYLCDYLFNIHKMKDKNGRPIPFKATHPGEILGELEEIKKGTKTKVLRRIWIIAAVVLLAIDLYVGLYEIYLYGVCSGKYFWDIDIFNLHPYKAATAIERSGESLLLLDGAIILLNAVFICITLLLRKSKHQ